MKTEKEITEQKQSDLQFITSAVTSELHDIAYLNYFDAWENNGGMGWFFTECVEITHKVMFKEGSPYLKWLEVWKVNTDKYCESFSEVTGETCFDWYHMNEARKEFESRYKKDECTKEQISEKIGYLINSFEVKADRDEVMDMALVFANKQREKDDLNKIVQDLRKINANADTMDKISKRLGINKEDEYTWR
tara:strand:+ start:700 stop:1275 length:576 start_codon:yes stop_codon:yes gene_type:complete